MESIARCSLARSFPGSWLLLGDRERHVPAGRCGRDLRRDLLHGVATDPGSGNPASLGAPLDGVTRLFVRHGLALSGIGAICGVAAALASDAPDGVDALRGEPGRSVDLRGGIFSPDCCGAPWKPAPSPVTPKFAVVSIKACKGEPAAAGRAQTAANGGASSSLRHLEFSTRCRGGLKLRITRRAKLSQMRTLRVYAGKRFVIHAVQADSSRATTAAAVSP